MVGGLFTRRLHCFIIRRHITIMIVGKLHLTMLYHPYVGAPQ